MTACLRHAVACLMLVLSLSTHAQTNVGLEPAGTNTAGIFQATMGALPTCLRWQPRGICIWVVCTAFYCRVQTTLRVRHFTPDVTISTWHDSMTHPWQDYGRLIATRLEAPGRWLVGQTAAAVPMLRLDSAGTKTEATRDNPNYVYRGADAIGNPANVIQGLITGNFGASSPSSIPIPTPIELTMWFTQFPTQVSQQWASVPDSYSSGQTDAAQAQMDSWYSTLGLASALSGAVGRVVNIYQTGMSYYTTATGALSLVDALTSGEGEGGAIGVSLSGSDLFCPPSIVPFGLAFQSDLDAPFWRSLLPLESIYPATWLPGMREVGQGLFQTWGSVWPRQGALFQQNPVKGSAVIAQRVGDIISYRAQPHIYSPLQLDTDPGYRFFGFQGIREHDRDHTTWQRVFPNPENQCSIFGSNDATAPMSFGAGHNFNARGAVWNAWRRQDCCRRPSGGVAIFIGSIPRGDD